VLSIQALDLAGLPTIFLSLVAHVASSWDPSLFFDPSFAEKSTLHDTKEPMKLFLVHTMLIVGSIWKSKSGSFLFLMSLWLLVAKEIVLTAGCGIHH
jgi:hypothetical protein